MAQQESSGNVPLVRMDMDSDLTLVDPQNYRYALNIRNGYGSIKGANTAVKGNSEIEYALPSGENVCIGTAEDERCKSVIYFIYNSNDQHLILRYYPGNRTTANPEGTIELVAQGPVFNFKKDWKINHAFLIDIKLLYWTDAVTEKDSIVGNPPRKINIEKANVTNRRLRYKLQTERAQDFFSTVPNDLTITIGDINNGNVSRTWQQADLNPFQGDPDGFLRFVETELLLNTYTPWLDVEFCVCELDLYTKNRFDETVAISLTSTSNIDGDLLLVPFDHYPIILNNTGLTYQLEEQHISYIKKPPRCEPTADYTLLPDVDANNVNNVMVQFRARYLYDDGEKSAWSAISNIPISLDLDGNFLRILNAIEVNYTENILALSSWRSILRQVELGFRVGNNNQLRSIDILDTCEIGITIN
ncbi:MAG: hypothetical protein K0U41_05980, partial [Gammaproteobacteria bacterium]|nr:hypothetical protein [Gammaproteobacteria bacterium]